MARKKIDEIVSKQAEDQIIRLTKLLVDSSMELRNNIEYAKQFDDVLTRNKSVRELRDHIDKITDSTKKLSDAEQKLKQIQDQIEESTKLKVQADERILAMQKKIIDLQGDEAKQAALLKNEIKNLNETNSKWAAVENSKRNSLERAQKLILLYTNEKKKLNLSTKEGALLNENYNKAIAKSNEYILRNADIETLRAKNIGKYNESLKDLFSDLDRKIKDNNHLMNAHIRTYGQLSPEVAKLRQEGEALRQLGDNSMLQKAFKTNDIATQAKYAKEALQDLSRAGLANTQIYERIRTGTASASGGFNSLRHSVTQIAREAPAAAYGLQTFIMGISNNIGPLKDDIDLLIAKNKELRAQGLPTKSVIGQVAGAFVSLNLVLSLAVTFLTLYSDEIGEFIKEAFRGAKSINEMTKQQELFNKALESNEIKQFKTDLAQLTINMNLAKKGLMDKEFVLNEYNDTLGSTIGLETDLDAANAKMVKSTPQMLRAMTYKVMAQEALNEAVAKGVEIEKLQNGGDLSVWQEFMAKLEVKSKSVRLMQMLGVYNSQRLVEEALAVQGYKNRLTAKLDKERTDAMNRAQSLSETSALIIKEEGGDAAGNLDKQKKTADAAEKKRLAEDKKRERERERADKKAQREMDKKEKEALKATQDRLEKERELYLSMAAARMESEMNFQKDILDNDNYTLDQRLAALDAFYTAKQSKQQVEMSKELDEAEKTGADTTEIINKYKNLELENISEKSKQKVAIIKSEHEQEIEAFEKNIDRLGEAMDAATAKEVEVLQKQFIDGKITREKYDNEVTKITQKGAIERLRIQLGEAQRSLDIANLTADEKIKIQERINKITADLNQAQVDAVRTDSKGNPLTQSQSNLQENASDLEKKLAEFQAYAEAIKSIYNDISSAVYDAELARLEEKDKKIQASYDLERRAIEGSAKSQAEKTKLLAKLDAENELKKKATERERAKIERRKAATDKIAAVFDIGLSTAIAIARSIKEFPITGGMPWAAINAALGAGQTAAVLAKPLPNYYKGRKGGPEEWAWVSERGQEAKRDKYGRVTLLPEKPSIVKLNAGDDVITHEELMKSIEFRPFAMLGNKGYMKESIDLDLSTLVQSQRDNTDDIIGELRNITEAITGLKRRSKYFDPSHELWVRNNIK